MLHAPYSPCIVHYCGGFKVACFPARGAACVCTDLLHRVVKGHLPLKQDTGPDALPLSPEGQAKRLTRYAALPLGPRSVSCWPSGWYLHASSSSQCQTQTQTTAPVEFTPAGKQPRMAQAAVGAVKQYGGVRFWQWDGISKRTAGVLSSCNGSLLVSQLTFSRSRPAIVSGWPQCFEEDGVRTVGACSVRSHSGQWQGQS